MHSLQSLVLPRLTCCAFSLYSVRSPCILCVLPVFCAFSLYSVRSPCILCVLPVFCAFSLYSVRSPCILCVLPVYDSGLFTSVDSLLPALVILLLDIPTVLLPALIPARYCLRLCLASDIPDTVVWSLPVWPCLSSLTWDCKWIHTPQTLRYISIVLVLCYLFIYLLQLKGLWPTTPNVIWYFTHTSPNPLNVILRGPHSKISAQGPEFLAMALL